MPFINKAKGLMIDPTSVIANSPMDILANTIICTLMRTSYSEVIDAQITYSEISTYEISATNYTKFGGHGALLSKAVAIDNTNDRAEFDAADFTYTGIGGASNDEFDYVVITRVGTANTVGVGNVLAAVGVTSTTTNGGDITLQWNAEGILQITT